MARKKFVPFTYPPTQEVYRDAFSEAIELGGADVAFDPETGRVTLDSGPVPSRYDFRSIHDQLSDGDFELLDLRARPEPRHFQIRYE